jgi:hypothetical protein
VTDLDVRVLRALPMDLAPGRWPTAAIVAERVGIADDVARSCLRRLVGIGLAEHDGERPRRYARTAVGESTLERR